MILGLNALKAGPRRDSKVLNAWFDGDENAEQTQPAKPAAVASQAARALLSFVQIAQSIKSIPHPRGVRPSAVPELPRFARHAPPVVPNDAGMTPYQLLNHILQPRSHSSQWLSRYGLLTKFTSGDTFVDINMGPDGSFTAGLRSSDGWRRTVVCRVDGSSIQRITGPQGEEILRFNNEGEPLRPRDIKRDSVPVLA